MLAWLVALAAAAPFRADHHDPGLRWRTVRTRFLRVHYAVSRRADDPHPVDAGDTAAEVARVGDDLVLRMGERLGWMPSRPIHVVVTDDEEGATAFTLPQWRWIVISADAGADGFRLRGRTDWVPDALAHELGHLFGHGLAASLPAGATYGIELGVVAEAAVGGAAATLTLPPNEPYGWSEGAAEYWSGAIGVNHWSPERAATLRTAALEGRLLEWDEWLVAGDKDGQADAERAYQQGYAFGRWLEETFGQDLYLALAERSGRRYRASWSRELRALTGEDARVTWARFRARLTADALADVARIRARGEVSGREIETWSPGGAPVELDTKDRWLARRPRDREETLEATGSWDLGPRMSPDGRWYGEAKVGAVRVMRAPETLWPGISGVLPDRDALAGRLARVDDAAWLPGTFGSSFAFVSGRDAVVVSAPQDALRRRASPRRPDPWNQLFVFDLTPDVEPVRHRGGEARVERGPGDSPRELRRRGTAIPGTLRARDPAVSPDGSRVAFVRTGDGHHHLEVVGLDGGGARVLDAFGGRAWLQAPGWSPDGRALVVSALHEGQPDLWRVDTVTGAWTRLTDDPAEQLDPWWAEDGIWFASDPDGVSDIYRLDPDSGRIDRMTRVIGGAVTPSVTPGGHLMYAGRTAHGTKAMAVSRDELLIAPVAPGTFRRPEDPDAPAELAFVPPAVAVAPVSYRSGRALLPVAGSPVVRFDLTERGPRPLGGAYLRVRDAIERVDVGLVGLAGEDLLGEARLTWRGLPPELTLWGSGSSDRSVPEGAGPDRRRSLGIVGLDLDQRWNDDLTVGAWGTLARLDDRVGARPSATRLSSARIGLAAEVGTVPEDDALGVGATLDWTRGWSEVPTGSYGFQRLQGRIAGATRTGVRSGPVAELAHRLEWSVTAGATSRPVSPDEQLRAGGDLPYALRLAAVEPSTALPGLPPFALAGDALAVGSATWVLPIAPRIRTGAGALSLRRLEAGLRADAAAAWSATDWRPAATVLDGAVELRLASRLLDARWDSVLRVAWAPRADGVDPPGEPVIEPAGRLGPRVVLGLGTGW